MNNPHELLVAHASATQTLLYAGVLVAIWSREQFVGYAPWRDKWRHTRPNLLLACSALPIQLLATVWIVASADLVTRLQWGLVFQLPFSANPLARTIALFFMLDACEYLYHRVMHASPFLWRFHLVHHSDVDVDVSTTLREHPGESLFRNGMMIAWVFTCGASIEALLARQTVMSIANLLSHGRLTLPRMLALRVQWLFVTPNFHHVHHHYQLPHTNSNFGDVFTLWDRMLGTYSRLPATDVRYGVDTHWIGTQGLSYGETLILPLARPTESPTFPGQTASRDVNPHA